MLKMTRSHAIQAGATFALASISMSGAMAQAQTLASTVSATVNKTGSRTGATGTGSTDIYTLSLASASAQASFVNEVNAGILRLALGADTASATTATYFGSTGTTAPSLSFTSTAGAVPEASSALTLGALLALGLTAGVVARRKRTAADAS